MTETLTHLINGEAVAAEAAGESLNPSNLDDVVARYPKAGEDEVNDAVKAARAAFPGWSEASPEVRSDVLDRAGSLIMARAKELGHFFRERKVKPSPKAPAKSCARRASANISLARLSAGMARRWSRRGPRSTSRPIASRSESSA